MWGKPHMALVVFGASMPSTPSKLSKQKFITLRTVEDADPYKSSKILSICALHFNFCSFHNYKKIFPKKRPTSTQSKILNRHIQTRKRLNKEQDVSRV